MKKILQITTIVAFSLLVMTSYAQEDNKPQPEKKAKTEEKKDKTGDLTITEEGMPSKGTNKPTTSKSEVKETKETKETKSASEATTATDSGKKKSSLGKARKNFQGEPADEPKKKSKKKEKKAAAAEPAKSPK